MSIAFRIVSGAKSTPGPLLVRTCIPRSGSARISHSTIGINTLFRSSPSASPLLLRAMHTNRMLSPRSAAALLTQPRFMSTTTTATPAKEEDVPIQGTTPAYNRHLLICTGVPAKDWVKKPEMSDPYLNLLMTTVRGQEVKVNFIEEDSDMQQAKEAEQLLPSKGPRHDLILFPDNIKFKGIRHEAFNDLNRYLAQHPVGTLRPHLEKTLAERNADNSSMSTELVPGSGEPVTIELVSEPSAILVCVHGSRDCRCGDQGGQFMQILKDMVQATGLTNSIKVYGVSHIGGHKYAPNTIMYPSGDWHGNLSELDSMDAQRILFDSLANAGVAAGVREKQGNERDPVMIDKWRGRMGMSRQEQIDLHERALEKQRQRQRQQGASSTVTQGQQEPQLQPQQQQQSLFSAPGEDLYEDDGLKEQITAVSVESNKPVQPAGSMAMEKAETVKIMFEAFQNVPLSGPHRVNRTEIEAKVGERILDIVRDKDPSRHAVYQALECTCGGQLECATCHVYIEEPYYSRLPAVTDAEEDMLEYAVGRKDSSRLGCQIKMHPDLEGMVVKLPQY